MQNRKKNNAPNAECTTDLRSAIRTMTDVNANLFNVGCLTVMAFMSLLTEILNEFGLFNVNRLFMLPATTIAFCAYILPPAIYLFSRRRNGTPVTKRDWFRILIIICGFIGTAFLVVIMSFQALIFTCLPILLAAQYCNREKTFVWVLAASLCLVPVGVYGGFFFGMPDRNFIKGMLTDEEALSFYNRLSIATPQRMLDLFTHYTLPRLFGIAAVAVLAMGIARRNGNMSEKQIELSEKIREELKKRQEMQNRVIELLANVIETRDVSTGEHIIHTKQYVEIIARAMQKDDKYRDILTDETIERMKNAAPLHDVGKITIPDTILLKPARLTAEEFDRMKTHTSTGGELIEKFFSDINDSEFLKIAEEIAVSHHEKWDGSGYPLGLKGEDIPLPARIMAVADVFDALVSVRVYKGSIEPDKAFEIIFSESGSHFDPDVIRIVRTTADDMKAIASTFHK